MARMRAISMNRWGEGGIQVSFELVPPVTEGMAVNHTEMAMPTNTSEFSRLMNVRLYDEFDVDAEKVMSA